MPEVKEMKRVYPAEPYRPGEMGSFGKASYMLIRQFNFPDTYTEYEKHHFWDSDRCFSNDYGNTRRCFTQHTGTGEMGLENWLRQAKDQKVINFLVDVLKADKSVKWTGYRVLGSVNRGNGYPVWTLELFAKDPRSNTNVYTGQVAPNVLTKPRREN